MKREKVILLAGVFLCFVVTEPSLFDMTLMPRWLVWSVVSVVLAALLRKSAAIPRNLIIPAFLLYLVTAVISLTRAYNVGEGICEVCNISLMFLYLIIASAVIKDIKDVAKPLTIFALWAGLYGLYYTYYVWEGQSENFATMGNINIWSYSHLLLLPFCFYMVFRGRLLWRIVASAAVIAATANIAITQCRTAILGLFAALTVSAATVLYRRRQFVRFAILVTLSLSALMASSKNIDSLHLESVWKRYYTWRQTIKLTGDRFMVGAGNWKLAIPLYATGFWSKNEAVNKAYENEYTMRPHNDYLWVASELSPFGGVVYILIFALALFYARGNPYIIMGLIGYMVVACFSFPKERAFMSMVLVIYLALSLGKAPRMRVSGFANYIFIIAAVLIAVFFAGRIQAERRSRQIVDAHAVRDWHRVIRLTADFKPKSYITLTGTPVMYYRGLAYEMIDDYQRAGRAYSAAARAHINHIYTLGGIGICYYKLGQLDRAADCYKRLLYIKPNHIGAKHNLYMIERKRRS